MNTPFRWEVQVCSEYDFSLKGTSLQWIRLFFERYKFAVNTTFVKKGTIFQWIPFRWEVQVNTTFLLQVCSEYDFSLKGTSLQWIRLLLKKVQFFSEYAFSLKSTSLQWIRLFFERYKFAVNTTFLWKVQVCSEYDFSLKGTSLQWIRLLLKKVQFFSEYAFSLRSTSLRWIRLFFERYKFAVNTTFLWKVQVCSEYDFC